MYISTDEELASFCESISTATVVAVDTEFLREKTFYPKLCLVQVGTADHIGAIDPLLVHDLTPLARILEDPNVTKVFHACSQDIEVLLDGMGVECAPIFDTQIAAAFLGLRQQASYGALVEAYTGVRLAKAESLTDWSKRPLDPEQLTYAEDDVRYLPGIYETMMRQLIEKDRLGWVMPEMAEHCGIEIVRRDPRRAYLRLKRSSSLTRRQLSVAREVSAWREERAAARDVPRRWVLSDEVVVEVARRAPQTVGALRRIRSTDSLSDRDADAVVRAVRAGLACPPDDYPKVEHRARPAADAEGVVDLMYALVRVVAETAGIAPQLIATREDLTGFMGDQESSRLAFGWRHDLVGAKLASLLAGEVGLTVKGGRVEVL